MEMKTEALALADELEHGVWYKNPYIEDKMDEASVMIRRLVEENDRIIRDLIGASLYEHDYKTLIEKLKPLSDEEMMKVIEQVACSYDPYEIEMSYDYEIRVAKAIEERHGIK